MTHDEINAFGEAIKRELLDGDEDILVSIAAHATDVDTGEPSCKATVSGNVGKVGMEFTSHAIHLADAIRLARGKLRAARLKHQAALDEARKVTA